MLSLSYKDFSEIQCWIHRHARPIELVRFRYHFEAPSQESSHEQADAYRQACRVEFLEHLAYYRNDDGGFGNALEPDNWNPDSTPYATLKVLELLEDMDLLGRPEAQPLIQDLLDYLLHCPFATEDGWPFNIPSNDGYPHAPWWTYDPKANIHESIGVTTGLCAYILQLDQEHTELYQKALQLATRMTRDFITLDQFGEMGLGGFAQLFQTETLLQRIPDLTKEDLMSALKTRIQASIERDTSLWIYHKPKPSQYIRTPESPWIEGLEDIVQMELDYLVQTRPRNGVWNIDWSWFDNNALYPEAFAVSETWWKAWGAIDKLLFLRGFGRLTPEC